MNQRTLVSAALALLLSLSGLPAALAGEGRPEVSIDSLREQIRGLEAAARDSSTTPEVEGLNAEFLNEKRRELARLLASRRAALRAYLATASASLNEREGARVRQAIEKLDAEVAALDASLAPVAAAAPPGTRVPGEAKSPNDAAASARPLAPAQDEPSDLARFEMKKKRAFDACSRCESPEKAFKIDARPNVAAEQIMTGETRTKVQRTRFRKGDHVNVSVFNMNPFLYKYTVRVEGKPVIETEHKKFLEALGGPLFGDLDGDGKTGTRGDGQPAAARGPVMLLREAGASVAERAACSGDAGEALKYVASVQQRVAEAEKKAEADFAYLGRKFKAAEAQYTKTRRTLYDPNADCAELCRASAEYTVYMEENPLGTMLDAFEAELVELGELNGELGGALAEFNSAHGAQCKVKVRGFDYAASLASYRARVDERVAAYAQQAEFWRGNDETYFSPLDDQIASVISHPDQTLRQEFLVGGYDTATDVTITLSWQELAQPQVYRRRPGDDGGADAANANRSRDTQPAGSSGFSNSSSAARAADDSSALRASARKQTELNFGGGPRFALSAGLVYSPFNKRKFGKVLGFERDAAGNTVDETPALTDVVGLKEESESRIGPLLMLSTRLTEFRDNNVFLSLGITGRRENGNTDIEYLVGPSFNLFDRRLFLTAGGYAGHEDVLNDDVHLGAKVSTDENITRSRLRWRPGFSLTYRIKFGEDEPKNGN